MIGYFFHEDPCFCLLRGQVCYQTSKERTMVKVLHIHTLPVISGSGLNTFLTMRGLDKSVYETALACAPDGKLVSLVRSHGMQVITIKNLVQPLHPLKDVLALFELTLFLKRNPFQVVHTHNSKAGFIGRLSATLAGVPVIIHTVHGFAFHDQEPPWKRFLYRNLERLASQWCDQLIFISQPLVDWALRQGIGQGKKMVRIYSGIELDQFNPVSEGQKREIRKELGIGEHDAVIGIVSKLWEGKGHSLLIDAFMGIKKAMGEAKLLIVGEGYLYQSLRAKVNDLGLAEAVLFTGFQQNVAKVLAAFDVAVLPSFFEGMGRVLLEAMAMEKPVVASRVGGIPDLVEDGVNGFLVTPGRVKELEQATLELLKDHSMAREMGIRGRKKITDRYSAQTMVRSIQEVYCENLLRKGIRVEA
jgi:glycosyltransferase involved in cell wall biosynthesis